VGSRSHVGSVRGTRALPALCPPPHPFSWSYQKYKSIEAAGGLHTVTLQSGDAILMGGPARMMHHTVASVQKNTCPAALKPLLGDARINITFRDAPGINAKDYKMYNV